MAISTPNTDPTDAGNAPGAGPLRVGGRSPSGDTIRDPRDLPSTRSASSEKQIEALEYCRDVWGGNRVLKDGEKSKTYLPQGVGEEADSYRIRLRRSFFHNFYRRTVEGLTGLVFREDPKLGDDVPPQIVQQWENIDLEGTHGDVFARERLQDAIVAGHNAILIEYPDTDGMEPGELSRAESVGEIRPYWVPIQKENIISWRTTNDRGRRILTQLVLEEKGTVEDGEYGEREQVLYRVFRRGIVKDERGEEAMRVAWILIRVTKDRQVILEAEGSYPTQDEIPVVEVGSSGSMSLFESDPPLYDFAQLNVAHYQQWSDQAMSIYKTCVPILFMAGVTQAMNVDGATQEIIVGPNSFINALDPTAKAEYVSHDGSALASVKGALDELKSDMGTLGLAMLSPQKRSAETAEAKRLDKATSDSALAVTARSLQDALEQCLYFHGRYLKNQPPGGSISVNRDFEGMIMDAPAMSAYAQLVNAGMPPRIALEMLKAGGRIPEDADLDALEQEWLMGAEVAKEVQQMEPAV